MTRCLTLPIAVGARIGPYEIRARIGTGGMGIVYEATTPTGDRVALKMLRPRWLRDKEAVRRFHDEAVAGQIVRHPNIAATLGHDTTSDGTPFLVMELVRGESLGARIRREGAPSLRRSVEIVREILAGLSAVHALGIVHGDVKSDNVLVTRRGGDCTVKLIDFGLACVQFTSDLHKPTTDEPVISGTPEYMAPEVIRGNGSLPASDVYAAGIILYELITGHTPFAGGTPDQIVRRHLVDSVVPPSLRRIEVPPILERIVLRAIEKAPARRFPSAEAFASALRVALPILRDDHEHSAPRFASETPTLNWAVGEAHGLLPVGT